MNRIGFFTTEFWVTVVTQVLAMLALTGVITNADNALLNDALAKCVTAGGVFIANAWVVVRYIQSRTRLKQSDAQPLT